MVAGAHVIWAQAMGSWYDLVMIWRAHEQIIGPLAHETHWGPIWIHVSMGTYMGPYMAHVCIHVSIGPWAHNGPSL